MQAHSNCARGAEPRSLGSRCALAASLQLPLRPVVVWIEREVAMKVTHAFGIPALAMALAMACSSGSGSGGSGGSGGGGSGGSSGIDCNESCGYLTTCCPGLTTQDCLAGCTQNPNNTPSCVACFDDTSCGSLDTCAIANCGLPQDVCYGTTQ